MIGLYNFFMIGAIAAAFPVLAPYLLLSEKRRKTFLARLGIASPPLSRLKTGAGPGPDDRTQDLRIWVHALSVGEVLSAAPLVKALADRPNQRVFFSASTHTGYQTASAAVSRFADGLLYFPYDLWPSVAAAVNRVRPDRMIVVETDLWPNFLYYLNRRGVPAFLVNARLSDRSFAGYRKIRFLVKPLLRSFHGICAQSERDANRFISLGADPEKVSVSGNLKFDQPVIPLTEDTRSRIRGRFAIPGDKPILVAGSTHPGEETVIARTLPSLLERLPDLRLIIVPRDPKRAASVRSEFRRSGRTALTMTERQDSLDRPFPEVLVADRIGLLKDLYAVAHAAFVGGSLVPKGGHNPLEASACGVPVMFGPHMSDFREVADILKTCGAAVQVDSGEAFIRSVHRFLTDAPAARIAGAAGMRVIRNNRGAVIRTLEQILPERLPWSCPSSV